MNIEIKTYLSKKGMEIIKDIPDLKKGEIYISHVGDGEYMFNVFGGVYTDKVIMFFSFLERIKLKKENIIITKPENSEKDFSFYHVHNYYCYEIARFTIETLDPQEFNTGRH